jgi:predicted Zn-dependent peptidase
MIINLKSQNDLSGFYIVYEGSTNLEKPGWYGLSHLMEHLLCKTFFHLLEDFDRDGIDWNASTSTNEIIFHFTGLESKLDKYRNKILKAVSNFDITKEQFENERNIVLSEYEDCFNEQSSSHYLNLYRKLFNDFDPIGLREDLENLKFMDCLNFFETQYMNPTKIINVSKTKKLKNLDIDFSDRKINKTIEYSNHNVPFELGNQFKDKTSLIMLSPVLNEDNNKIHFLNSMISLGLKSPLYQEVREEKGLVYFIHCYQSRHNLQGITNISTQTSNKNVNAVIDAVEKVFKNKDKFLNKDRFNLVKDYYMARRDKEEILRYGSIGKYLVPDGWSVYDILDTIKLKDIKDVFEKNYDFSKFYISSDKKEFSK